MTNAFPHGFLWGAATSSYQTEGAVADDGRGESCWDVFARRPGAVHHGDSADIACDSYHRLGEDLAIIGEIGLSAYRFSIAWSRILPDGTGTVNPKGLDHYGRLVDGLLERGVTPMVTLFHWDLPETLQRRGGWASRDCAGWFADYVGEVAGALGDRVRHWITLNEPWVVAHRGYRDGSHAPGIADPVAAAAATHHLLLGHGLAAEALRSACPGAPAVGITLDPLHAVALDRQDEPLAAEIAAGKNEVFLGPILDGRYPDLDHAELLPGPGVVRGGDLATIAAPLDFLGVNYYDPIFVRRRHGSLGRAERDLRGYPEAVAVIPEEKATTAMGWVIDPDSFHALLVALKGRAPHLPIYVTENGLAAHDYVDPSGAVKDPGRTDYLSGHLRALKRAIDDGVDVRGYFVWSLLDNFEWTDGYSQRLGLVYVDFGTQRRILKDSARFYAQVIAANALPDGRL